MVNAVEAWRAGFFTAGELAAGLECGVEDVRLVLAGYGHEPGGRVQWTGRQKIGLAVAITLHADAAIPLQTAAEVVRGCARICDSILSIAEFVPSPNAAAAGECDPFMLFAPHVSEAIAIPAIDEFLDVMDGRRICWRRPRRDPLRLANDLHRLSQAVRCEDTPALRDEYLELLSTLREPPDHVSEWIGTISDGRFRPAPSRFAETFPAMKQGLDAATDPSLYAETYGTRISLNVSLAARTFKRRMLGLEVTDPSGSHRGGTTNEGASRP